MENECQKILAGIRFEWRIDFWSPFCPKKGALIMKTHTAVATRPMAYALLAVGLTFPGASGAASAPDHVVFPTGLFPLDVQNVQAALNGGGTVLLKATNPTGLPTSFNFGPSDTSGGWVEFHVDAELIGERVAGAATTIEGGSYPVEANGLPLSIAVRDIVFRSSFDGALLLYDCADTVVTGVHTVHTIGRHVTPNLSVAEVIVVGFSGRVLIEDNVIEDVAADLGFGVSQFRAAGPVVIHRNTISDTGYGTIESSFNANFATGTPATVSITENRLRPGPAPGAFGAGIEINGEGAYYVARNDILIESPNGIGVYALGAPDFGIAAMVGPVIEKNKIQMQPPIDLGPVFADGIDLVGTVSQAYVGQNAIEGRSFSALGAYNVNDSSDLAFNAYIGNQIATFEPTVAHIVLDSGAHDNVVTGFSGSVLDFGVNNHVTGFNANGVGVGALISEAKRRRNEANQATMGLLRRHGAMP